MLGGPSARLSNSRLPVRSGERSEQTSPVTRVASARAVAVLVLHSLQLVRSIDDFTAVGFGRFHHRRFDRLTAGHFANRVRFARTSPVRFDGLTAGRFGGVGPVGFDMLTAGGFDEAGPGLRIPIAPKPLWRNPKGGNCRRSLSTPLSTRDYAGSTQLIYDTTVV